MVQPENVHSGDSNSQLGDRSWCRRCNLAHLHVEALNEPAVKLKRGHRHGKGPTLQVGDYVQWTSDGVDQFKPARKVTQIQDRHVWVDGSQTGIPISEVTVVEPHAPIPVAKRTTPAKSGPSDQEGDGNEISVLVTPQGRLQISADLDAEGLGKLRQMLEQYEQILKLLK